MDKFAKVVPKCSAQMMMFILHTLSTKLSQISKFLAKNEACYSLLKFSLIFPSHTRQNGHNVVIITLELVMSVGITWNCTVMNYIRYFALLKHILTDYGKRLMLICLPVWRHVVADTPYGDRITWKNNRIHYGIIKLNEKYNV